jgi:prophage maintenance system killer protein
MDLQRAGSTRVLERPVRCRRRLLSAARGEQVTGSEAAVLAKASPIDLADSALHAPSASFGGAEFYPDVVDTAAVLACRLAWNHSLLDGNKCAARSDMALFIDLNGRTSAPDPPDVDDAERRRDPARRLSCSRGARRGCQRPRAVIALSKAGARRTFRCLDPRCARPAPVASR